MTRRIICMFVLVAFSSLMFYSCTESDSITKAQSRGEEGFTEDHSGGFEIIKAPEVAELEGIRDRLAEAARARGLSGQDFKKALRTEEDAVGALGIEESEAEVLRRRITVLAESIRRRYPDVDRTVAENDLSDCLSCDAEEFASMWDTKWRHINEDISATPGRGLVGISGLDYIKYVTTLVLCAVSSGGNLILYLFCAYLAYCHYSEDSALC